MTFIIHFKDGHRETYNNRYNENAVTIASNKLFKTKNELLKLL